MGRAFPPFLNLECLTTYRHWQFSDDYQGTVSRFFQMLECILIAWRNIALFQVHIRFISGSYRFDWYCFSCNYFPHSELPCFRLSLLGLQPSSHKPWRLLSLHVVEFLDNFLKFTVRSYLSEAICNRQGWRDAHQISPPTLRKLTACRISPFVQYPRDHRDNYYFPISNCVDTRLFLMWSIRLTRATLGLSSSEPQHDLDHVKHLSFCHAFS